MIKSLKKFWNAKYNLGRARSLGRNESLNPDYGRNEPVRSGAALLLDMPLQPGETAAGRVQMMFELEQMYSPSLTTVMHVPREEWAPGLWAGTEGATLRIESVDLENRTITVRFE